MNKKIFIPLVAVGIVVLGVGHYIEDMGNVMHTRVVLEEVSDSKLTSDEVFDAIDLVRKDFRKTFRDCELTDLSYDLDLNGDDSRSAVANRYQAQEAVIISGNIKASRTYEDLGVEKGNTYTGYRWLVTRTSADGQWEIKEYNYDVEQKK